MNVNELHHALEKLSDQDFQKFVSDFGGAHQNREAVVRAFVDHPEYERRLCHLLRLTTEAEKTVQAALDAASRSKWSVVIAAIATAISFLAFLLSIYNLFR